MVEKEVEIPVEEVQEETTEEIKENEDWIIQMVPARFIVVDPKTKSIIAEAEDIETLKLILAVKTTQNSEEAAINSR